MTAPPVDPPALPTIAALQQAAEGSAQPASVDGLPGWAALGLGPALARAASAAGWQRPTAVQAAALPAVLAGRDLLALAPTGSGKTAAFLLPLLQRLAGDVLLPVERPRRLRVLLLSPTRELALQTAAGLRVLADGVLPKLKAVVAVGGASINPQMLALRGGAHVVVATPGRLLDLRAQRALSLGGVQTLVLDEADRLLDAGFADEVQQVLAALPARRQTLMFTATLPADVQTLADRVLHDPLRLQAPATAEAPRPDIAQRAIVVDTARRTALLRQLLGQGGWQRVLVFVATQYASEHVADKLRRGGVAAQALHGRQSPGRRAQVLADLQAGRLQVLVATDLAARGLDLAGLDLVVNHDLARSAVDHVHRIGRTGRAGTPGLAISLLLADAPGSEAHWRLIEKRTQQPVPREQVPGFEPAATPAPAAEADAHGGVKGRRPSKKDRLRAAAAALATPGGSR